MEDLIVSRVQEYGMGFVVFCVLVYFISLLVRTFTKAAIEEGIKAELGRGLETYKQELVLELEKFRTALTKSQTVFQLQLQALTQLRTIFRKVIPKKRHPHEEWDSASERIAYAFERHANRLDLFLSAHGAILPFGIIAKVEAAVLIATDGAFQFVWDSDQEDVEPTAAAIQSADRFYETLKEAVDMLQKCVDQQLGQNPPSGK